MALKDSPITLAVAPVPTEGDAEVRLKIVLLLILKIPSGFPGAEIPISWFEALAVLLSVRFAMIFPVITVVVLPAACIPCMYPLLELLIALGRLVLPIIFPEITTFRAEAELAAMAEKLIPWLDAALMAIPQITLFETVVMSVVKILFTLIPANTPVFPLLLNINEMLFATVWLPMMFGETVPRSTHPETIDIPTNDAELPEAMVYRILLIVFPWMLVAVVLPTFMFIPAKYAAFPFEVTARGAPPHKGALPPK